jgi:hypothetical protein
MAPPLEIRSYRIHIDGHLDPGWSDWFDGLAVVHEADGTTTLAGPVADQAALYGLLGRARDLGLTLLGVQRVEANAHENVHARSG